MILFEWDKKKNNLNLQKHGISFEDAEFVFSSKAVTFVDDRYDYNEERLITLGELMGRIVVVVRTQRSEYIQRIISMRKANEREKKIYYQRLKEIGSNER